MNKIHIKRECGRWSIYYSRVLRPLRALTLEAAFIEAKWLYENKA